MIHVLRYVLLLLMLTFEVGASASEGGRNDEWQDADQLRHDRQMAVLSDTNHACRIYGPRPSRVQPVNAGKPAKPTWRSSQSLFYSPFHFRWAASRLFSIAQMLPCVSCRVDFIALRHIIR